MPFTMLATAKYVVQKTCDLAVPSQTKRARLAPPAAALADIDLPQPPVLGSTSCSSAPLTMAIYKLSNDAGDTMPEYRGASNANVYEVLMEHPASPSLLYDLKTQFESFLQHAHHTAMVGDAPTSLQDMRDVAGAPHVQSSPPAPVAASCSRPMRARAI